MSIRGATRAARATAAARAGLGSDGVGRSSGAGGRANGSGGALGLGKVELGDLVRLGRVVGLGPLVGPGRLGNLAKAGRGRRVAAAAARPDFRPREGEVLDPVVDAEVGVLVAVLVRAGELDHGPGVAGSSVDHLDLHAGDIVLGLVHVRAVDAYI